MIQTNENKEEKSSEIMGERVAFETKESFINAKPNAREKNIGIVLADKERGFCDNTDKIRGGR